MTGVVTLLLVCLAAPALAQPAMAPAEPPPEGSKRAFSLQDSEINESSGLAASNVHDGVAYTLNDSGGGAEVYAIDEQGETVATLTMRLVEPIDWEALAPGPDDRIWVGDIGDNDQVRDQISLYRFREPESLTDQRLLYGHYEFAYPDGAHDAEALLVHPQTGEVYIVTKDVSGAAIYQGPEDPSIDGVNELTKVAKAPRLVTDGAFLPDGSAMVLRTYGRAYVLDWPSGTEKRQLALPTQEQGESLTVTPDGKRVLVGAEGSGSTVWSVPVNGPPPRDAEKAPGSTSKPTKDGSEATPAPTEQAGSGGTDDASSAGMSTWVLVSVLVVGVLAGVAAFPRRRRRVPPNAGSGRPAGGLGAGRPDAGRPDAGRPDAGPDGGRPEGDGHGPGVGPGAPDTSGWRGGRAIGSRPPAGGPPAGGPPGGRPPAEGPHGVRPGGAPPGGGRPGGGRPGGGRPDGGRPGGGRPGGPRPGAGPPDRPPGRGR